MKYFLKFLMVSGFIILSYSIQEIPKYNLNNDVFKVDDKDVQFHDTPNLIPKFNELDSTCVGKYSKILSYLSDSEQKLLLLANQNRLSNSTKNEDSKNRCFSPLTIKENIKEVVSSNLNAISELLTKKSKSYRNSLSCYNKVFDDIKKKTNDTETDYTIQLNPLVSTFIDTLISSNQCLSSFLNTLITTLDTRRTYFLLTNELTEKYAIKEDGKFVGFGWNMDEINTITPAFIEYAQCYSALSTSLTGTVLEMGNLLSENEACKTGNKAFARELVSINNDYIDNINEIRILYQNRTNETIISDVLNAFDKLNKNDTIVRGNYIESFPSLVRSSDIKFIRNLIKEVKNDKKCDSDIVYLINNNGLKCYGNNCNTDTIIVEQKNKDAINRYTIAIGCVKGKRYAVSNYVDRFGRTYADVLFSNLASLNKEESNKAHLCALEYSLFAKRTNNMKKDSKSCYPNLNQFCSAKFIDYCKNSNLFINISSNLPPANGTILPKECEKTDKNNLSCFEWINRNLIKYTLIPKYNDIVNIFNKINEIKNDITIAEPTKNITKVSETPSEEDIEIGGYYNKRKTVDSELKEGDIKIVANITDDYKIELNDLNIDDNSIRVDGVSSVEIPDVSAMIDESMIYKNGSRYMKISTILFIIIVLLLN